VATPDPPYGNPRASKGDAFVGLAGVGLVFFKGPPPYTPGPRSNPYIFLMAQPMTNTRFACSPSPRSLRAQRCPPVTRRSTLGRTTATRQSPVTLWGPHGAGGVAPLGAGGDACVQGPTASWKASNQHSSAAGAEEKRLGLVLLHLVRRCRLPMVPLVVDGILEALELVLRRPPVSDDVLLPADFLPEGLGGLPIAIPVRLIAQVP